MPIKIHHKVGFFDIDHQLKLTVQSVARFFQEIATLHSVKVGVGPDVLSKRDVGWLLNRLEIELFRYPVLGEDIHISTWSRGFKGVKGYRDYLIYSSKGEIARGSGIWIFYNSRKKRIARIPKDISTRYEVENEKWFDHEIEDWKTCGQIESDQNIDISLRYSDFDMNGHVNNTKYIGFLETLYHHAIHRDGTPIKNIKLRFYREIDKKQDRIQACCKKSKGVYHCNILDSRTLYADAEIVPMDSTEE